MTPNDLGYGVGEMREDFLSNYTEAEAELPQRIARI